MVNKSVLINLQISQSSRSLNNRSLNDFLMSKLMVRLLHHHHLILALVEHKTKSCHMTKNRNCYKINGLCHLMHHLVRTKPLHFIFPQFLNNITLCSMNYFFIAKHYFWCTNLRFFCCIELCISIMPININNNDNGDNGDNDNDDNGDGDNAFQNSLL